MPKRAQNEACPHKTMSEDAETGSDQIAQKNIRILAPWWKHAMFSYRFYILLRRMSILLFIHKLAWEHPQRVSRDQEDRTNKENTWEPSCGSKSMISQSVC